MADAKNKAAQQAITAHLQVQAIAQPALSGGWLLTIFLSLILPVLDSLLILAAPTIQANSKLLAIIKAVYRECGVILSAPTVPPPPPAQHLAPSVEPEHRIEQRSEHKPEPEPVHTKRRS